MDTRCKGDNSNEIFRVIARVYRRALSERTLVNHPQNTPLWLHLVSSGSSRSKTVSTFSVNDFSVDWLQGLLKI